MSILNPANPDSDNLLQHFFLQLHRFREEHVVLQVDVAVQVGQKVQAGERVAVIEAMKMENILTASQDGVVKDVLASKGESLAVDQPIMRMPLIPSIADTSRHGFAITSSL